MLFIWGNKIDMRRERVISTEEGLITAEKYNAWFIETSAKDNINIEELFTFWVTNLIDSYGYDFYNNE